MLLALATQDIKGTRSCCRLCASFSPPSLSDLTMSEKAALESKLPVLTDEVTMGTLSFVTGGC